MKKYNGKTIPVHLLIYYFEQIIFIFKDGMYEFSKYNLYELFYNFWQFFVSLIFIPISIVFMIFSPIIALFYLPKAIKFVPKFKEHCIKKENERNNIS